MNEHDIYHTFKGVIDAKDRLIVLHSSLLHFRVDWQNVKWPLLSALRRLIQDGYTLALPTFTLSYCRGTPFHHQNSSSEVGQLGDWFLELEEVERSRHPIYSFAVAGPESQRILSCPSTTACGTDSPFGLFHKENALFICLGANPKDITQLHYYEEESKVPYRYYKDFSGKANYGKGDEKVTARLYARHIDRVGKVDFQPAINRLRQIDAFRRASFADGKMEAVECRSLAQVARELLKNDPFSLMRDGAAIARHAIDMMNDRNNAPPIKIALLGNHNLSFLKSALKQELDQRIPGRRFEIFTPDFGQTYQEILRPDSNLNRLQADFIFFTDRIEDIFQENLLEFIDGSDMEPLSNHLDMLRSFQLHSSGTLFINRFTTMTNSVNGVASQSETSGKHALITKANAALDVLIKELDNLYGFDMAEAARLYVDGPIHDPRLWFLGRIPYSQGFTTYLAQRFSGLILSATERTARLLVVDLDNTMWGGILGEDGLEGIQLGGDHPGNAFLYFQQVLKKLMDRGIAIAIASKNDEDLAMQAINTHPEMVIKADQLAAWRINWNEKWRNVTEIAEEVGLGLENIMFIDDNPVERQHMRINLPGVKVVELPDDPALYAQTLLAEPYLECLKLTQEDSKRARRYVAKRRIEESQKSFSTPEAFFSSLDIRLHVANLNKLNMARGSQLIQKTNQFNTTSRRYSSTEMLEITKQGNAVFVIGLEDRFSDFENIGLAVVRWNHPKNGMALIDLFLLSCRVLGRGIETGFLAWLAKEAKNRGMALLSGEIVHSKRNTPVRELFNNHGFKLDTEENTWVLDLNTNLDKIPEWITLLDHSKEESHD
ncbi:MAG: HAD-IIIC family phosphatase [Magnetococcales bacterium]|nr:HAD-IIIC family phosphatase [Magnetococcales bacterium]